MKVFVTGGTGFIGGEVVRQLRDRGDEVVCLVRSPEKAAKLTELGCELRQPATSATREALRAGMEGCDAVIHAAAMYEVGIPSRSTRRCARPTSPAPSACSARRWRRRSPRSSTSRPCGVFGNTHDQVVDESYEHPGKDFTSYYEETKLEAHRIAKRMIAERPARR